MRLERFASGNLLLAKSTSGDDYMSVDVYKDTITLKIRVDDYFGDVSIKYEEIDSSWVHVEIKQQQTSWKIDVNGEKRTLILPDVPDEICNDHLYIGNIEV